MVKIKPRITIVLIFAVFLLVVLLAFLTQVKVNNGHVSGNERVDRKKYSTTLNLAIRGSSIYISDPQKGDVELLKHSAPIKLSKLSDDGRLLHFKSSDGAFCANLSDLEITGSFSPIYYPSLGKDFKPSTCWKTSGFLENSDYYSYLKISEDGRFKIVFEDLTLESGQDEKSFSFDLSLPLKYKGAAGIENIKESLVFDGVSSDSGYYVYPQEDVVSGDLVLLSYGRLIALVDVKTKELKQYVVLEKGNDPFGLVKNSFELKNENDSPYIILYNTWEGRSPYLIDIASNTIKIVDIRSVFAGLANDYAPSTSRNIDWYKDRIVFSPANVVLISLPDGYSDGVDWFSVTDSQTRAMESEVESLLEDPKVYQKVECDLSFSPSRPLACFGYRYGKIVYEYTNKNGLVKLQ